MSFETITFEQNGPVATIALDRPKQLNAMNIAMRAELLEVVRKIDAIAEIRVVIIKSTGRIFSAGQDLTEPLADPVTNLVFHEYKPLFSAIADSNKIYIAQVNGTAAGISAALVLSCDFMVMADDASVYFAFAHIGLIPDGGSSWHLVQAMGRRVALEVIADGKHVTAEACERYGLSNKTCAPDALDETTRTWAEALAQRAPLALAAAKRISLTAATQGWHETVYAEAQEQTVLTRSQDFKRGVKALMSKEKPVFEGN